MKLELVKVEDITITDRARVDMGTVGELAESMRKRGLLQPIVLDHTNTLRAGGRRLEAAKLLKWSHIHATRLEELSLSEQLLVELEENSKRKDLTWQETAGLVRRVFAVLKETGLQHDQIADKMSMSPVSLHQYNALNKAMDTHPEISQVGDYNTALRKASIHRENALRSLEVQALGLSEGIQQESAHLQHGDCLTFLSKLESNSVDLILSDPPYGIEYGVADNATEAWDQTFSDSYEHVFKELLPPVLKEIERVLKPGAHFYLFFPEVYQEDFYHIVQAAGLKPQTVPLIWYKGATGGAMKYYVMNYEPVLFGHKGEVRNRLREPGTCVIPEPILHHTQKIHPTEKPVKLLEYFIQQSTIKGELVVDPFAGSGSTLVAAIQQGRRTLGFEKDERWYNAAVQRISRLQLEPTNATPTHSPN